MRYFIVSTTIKDGEYEYLSQSPVQAEDPDKARLVKATEALEWVASDYREAEVDTPREITKDEYDVIARYIY